MKRSIAVLLATLALGVASTASAQDLRSAAGPAPVVVTIIPGGGTFFTESKTSGKGPSFGNYDLGGAVTFNVNRYVGFEGEVSGSIGVEQNLTFAGTTADRTT